MKAKLNKKIFLLLVFTSFISVNISAQITNPTQAKDSTNVLMSSDTLKLKYPFKNNEYGGLFLGDPSVEIIFDDETNQYIIIETIGEYQVKRPVYMTREEFKEYRLKRDMLEYYKDKISATNSKKKGSGSAQKNLLPKYYVNSKFFETVFGGNAIEVIPQGSIEIDLGILYQNVDNPQLSEKNRKSFNFDFDQQISVSIVANIGERMKFNAQFDTQSTFDFQNMVKLEFTPPSMDEVLSDDRVEKLTGVDYNKTKEDVNKLKEKANKAKSTFDDLKDPSKIGQNLGAGGDDNILKKLEVGNVSMPVKNSLIIGAQSLFGVKTQLQFGKTTVTGVFAEQKSQTRSVTSQGGSTVQEFEIQTSEYDANRHFFLAHYFRENYDDALANNPSLINSPINITKVEVWVTNRNSNTTDVRNIVAIADLGETNVDNVNSSASGFSGDYPSNDGNEISSKLVLGGPIREISSVSSTLDDYNMQEGTNYSKLENAVKLLENSDYTFHPQLGYISLNRQLFESEVLGVAFEYTVNGNSEVFKVGEFTSDGVIAPDNIVVKLLRSEIISTDIHMWKLMMKNVYSLQAYGMERNGFRFEVMYADDETGVKLNVLQNAATNGINEKTLSNLLSVDVLDQSYISVAGGDGYFDYIEGITVNSNKGYIMFPTVEPFGATLDDNLTDTADKKYVFNELYENTQSVVQNTYQSKDKYYLKGYLKTENAQGIPLGAFNVPQGSVRVTAGGRELIEGIDYVVDYQMSRVQIIDPGLEASNTPIEVSVENNATFNLQTKRFIGLDVEHKFSDKFIAGATFLSLREKPLTQKVSLGQEPFNNTIIGFNATYNTEVPKLTRWLNKLPNIDTDVPSNLSVRGDFAYLMPGASKRINQDGEATSYIDDFENSQIPLDIRTPQQWYMASTPQNQDQPDLIDLGGDIDGLPYGYKRARLAWYSIDPIFYGSSSTKPSNIDNEEVSRNEVRRIRYSELFPELDLDITQSTIVRTFDLAYFPNERGSYNYDDTNIDANGKFTDPEDRWAGIMRSLTTTNFEQANIEYIQFWLMDPYDNYSITNEEGLPVGTDPSDSSNQVGELYFNLGNISEDILKDNAKLYENGLPVDDLDTYKDSDYWGKIPANQSLLYAFSDSDTERLNQDVGFDGINDVEENNKYPSFGPDDPSNDNYSYFRSSEYDNIGASILTRYKKYNNTEGNSPTNNLSPENYPTAATTYPDVEDINKDQTMNTIESYYQYKVSLNQDDLNVDSNPLIVDEKERTVTLEDGTEKTVKWYQFRIQVANYDEEIGGISDFNSIRFMRMFLTKFKMPVVLRFGELQLVRGDYRRYTQTIDEAIVPSQPLTAAELQNFEVGIVNIEENEDRDPIPYVVPPGIEREVLRGASNSTQYQNEQSVSIKVTELEEGEARAIFKNVSVDLRMYKKIKMFVHAEGTSANDDLKAIIRIGSDITENFYQIEKKLVVTSDGATTPLDIWPEENNIELLMKYLTQLKLKRHIASESAAVLYPLDDTQIFPELEGYQIRVKGNPNLGNIKTIMLGVKNVSTSGSKTAEIWFNELRAAGFDNDGGWSAVVSADLNLADFADIAVTGRMETIGFGGIEQRLNERTQEDTKIYDIVTNVNVGKLLPKTWAIELPLNYSISEEFRDPKYDPRFQDVLFEDAKEVDDNSKEARDYTKRKSINLINVRKGYNPEGEKKRRFYDVENLSVSYAFDEEYHRDYNIQKYLDQNVRASANYNYNFKPLTWEPFKKADSLNPKYFKIIKDINFNIMPSSFSISSNIIRNYNVQQSRSLVTTTDLPDLPTLTQRRYMFDWDYGIGFNLTKSIKLDFRATNNNIFDDFNEDDKAKLFTSFFDPGRPDHYHQSLSGTYKIPIDKLPFIDFLKANLSYTADFDWQATSPANEDFHLIGNVIQNANTIKLDADIDFKTIYKTLGIDKLTKKKSKSAVGSTDTKLRNNSKKNSPLAEVRRGFFSILTMVQSARINYTENNGTYLPGYLPEVGLLGRNNYNGSLAPSFGYVFGSQINIMQLASEKGWLVSRESIDDPYYNKTYKNTHFNKLDVSFALKPFPSLTIDLRGSKTYTKNSSQQFDVILNDLKTDSPISQMGNFSVNYNMIGTSFDEDDFNFEEFKNNRLIIARRLAIANGQDPDLNPDTDGFPEGFGKTNIDVQLPAFLAAYSGKNPDKIKLSAFRDIPIPSWNVTYRGLMKLKFFKEHFSNFSLSHSYNSLYSITNYTSNMKYNASDPFSEKDIADNYYSKILYSNVNLIEEFSPLVKVDMKMKNSLSFSGVVNRDRGLTLNFTNNTITQIKGVEYVVGVGYRIKDLPMKIKFGGKMSRLKGDLNIKLDVSLRDNKTVVRAVDEDNDQVTGGQRLLSVKLLADYNLSKSFTASLFFDQSASKYAISTTYPRKSISAGLSLRYILGY